MNVFVEMLKRRDANGPKVAVLFLIFAAGIFALDAFGVDDLSSPELGLALIPPVLIYLAERLGKIAWFTGLTLPSLLVMAAWMAFIWALNARAPVPSALTYCAVAALIAALGFLLFRLWSFGPNSE